jgi:hypothetical protein
LHQFTPLKVALPNHIDHGGMVDAGTAKLFRFDIAESVGFEWGTHDVLYRLEIKPDF